MSLYELSASDVEAISSADTQSDKVTDAGCGVGPSAGGQNGKHPLFFFETSFISFLVENTLYRVHDYPFKTNSLFWSRKLGVERDDTAIFELDVPKADMDALLAVLYNRNLEGHEPTTYSEWESVLRLSTRWEFESIRALAIDMLEPLASPLHKLVLGRSFDVPQWLQPALVSLCMRKEPLSLSEANRLPMADVVAIAAAREEVRQASLAIPSEEAVSAYVEDNILRQHIPPVGTSSITTQPLDTKVASPSESAQCPSPTSQPILSLAPCPQEAQHLLSALLESRYHDALDMVNEESAQVLVDVLRDFTGIWKEPLEAEAFIDTVLQHGAEKASFIPTGTKILSTLPSSYSYDSSVWSHVTVQVQVFKECTDAIRHIKTRYAYADMMLAAQHVSMAVDRHHYFFTTLSRTGPSGLTDSLYIERRDNLYAFYTRLAYADLTDSSYLR